MISPTTRQLPLVEAILDQASRNPNSTAVADCETSLSFEQLDRASRACCAEWLLSGLSPGQAVAIHLPRSARAVVAYLSALRMGCPYAPVDPSAPERRKSMIIERLRPALLVGDPVLQSDMSSPLTNIWVAAPRLEPQVSGSAAADFPSFADEPPNIDRPAYVMFTSGSTGVPKGVEVSTKGLLPLLTDDAFIFEPAGATWLQITSPGFDISHVELWAPLLHGGRCAILSRASSSLREIGRFVVDQGVTHAQFSAGLFNALVDEEPETFTTLKQVVIGGERASARHCARFLARHPGVVLTNAYGPTETTIWSLVHRVSPEDCERPEGIPIGKPISGTSIRIHEAEGTGAHGELWIGGQGVAIGYLNDPEQTAARFPVDEQGRWYRTGDLVSTLADGTLVYRGRADRQVKVSGVRMELEEIERAIETHPGIDKAAVWQLPDGSLHGVFSGQPATAQSLQTHLSQRIPSAAIPQLRWRTGSLPRNLNGKVDLDRLRLEDQSPVTDHEAAALEATPASFAESLRDAFTKYGSRVAVEGHRERLTYEQLERESSRVADLLRAGGVRPKDVVVIAARRSVEWVIAAVSCIRIGATYAPVDLDSPPKRLQQIIQLLTPKLVLAGRSHPDLGWFEGVPSVRLGDSASPETPLEPRPGSPWDAWTDESQPLCIMFTSGSTGTPKGVMVPPSGLARLVISPDFVDLNPEQRWAFLSSPAFDAAHLEVWAPLINGGCCVVFEGQPSSLDEISEFLKSKQVDCAWLTAALFNALVDSHLDGLGELRQLLVGGERLSPRHVRRMLDRHPDTALINGYGPTENTTFTLCHRIAPADTENPDQGVPIGKPINGTVVMLDGDVNEGELLAGGVGIALGYLGDPKATADRFIQRAGQRWYRTGDRVIRRADGSFLYVGRVDRQVKIQGHRIELDEVEGALASCPKVDTAAVLVDGEEAHDRRLVGFFSGSGQPPPEVEDVANWLEQRLPPGALPKVLIRRHDWPRNSNGKVDREALANELRRGPSLEPAANDPGNPPERVLASLWRQLLPNARTDPDSQFTLEGGTSLTALRLSSAILKQLGADVSPVELLRKPSFKQHLDLIASSVAKPVQTPARGASPALSLTRAQRDLIDFGRLNPRSSAMLVHTALLIGPEADLQALRQAFIALAQRHPLLRVLVDPADSTKTSLSEALHNDFWQEHADPIDPPKDLDYAQGLLAVINRPIELSKVGPMRVDVWPQAGTRALLVWTVHHFAVDESSIETALDELHSIVSGANLPPVYGSPFGFASLEAAWTDVQDCKRRAEKLAIQYRGHELPFDRHEVTGREQAFPIPGELQTQLLERCAEWGCTPTAPLLAAFGLALQEVFGGHCRHVLTPFSRRAEPELIEPIGYLLDVRHIDAGIRSAESPMQHLSRVHDELISAQAPSFEPLSALVEHVAYRDPQAARWLGMFGFTWRLETRRQITLGNLIAEQVRVPQTSPRFGLALHITKEGQDLLASVEACQSAWSSGQAERVWAVFLRRLQLICRLSEDLNSQRLSDSAKEPGTRDTIDAELMAARLEPLWRAAAPYTGPSLEGSAHFLRLGGSSLAAMRMATEIKRLFGISLDTAAFLKKPTFGRLVQMLSPGVEPAANASARSRLFAWIGPDHPRSVSVLFPGLGGHAVGMMNLATALQRLAGPGHSCAIVDMEWLVERGRVNASPEEIIRYLAEEVSSLGGAGTVHLAGFSLGGLIALKVGSQIGSKAVGLVSLLDAFSPRSIDKSVIGWVERRLAPMFLRLPSPQEVNASPPPDHLAEIRSARESPERWERIESWLTSERYGDRGLRVQLIKARHSAKDCAILWRADTNGFNPAQFKTFSSFTIPAWHVDILNRSAAICAHLLAAEFSTTL